MFTVKSKGGEISNMQNKKKIIAGILLSFYVLFCLSEVDLNEIDSLGALLQVVIESIASKHVPLETEVIYEVNAELFQHTSIDYLSELSDNVFH